MQHFKVRRQILPILVILAVLVVIGFVSGPAPQAHATTVVVTPAVVPTALDNDFTRIQNAVATAVNGDIIDLQGTFDWTEPNALADYTASFSASATGDIRGVEIPSGVNNLTITSSTNDAHIKGAGDISDGTLIFSAFMFADDGATPGNTNFTMEKLWIDDFEAGIVFGWNATGVFDGTTIQDNVIVLAGDDGDATDWIQNIAIYFWRGYNQTIQNNTVTFQADGTRTVGYGGGSKNGASFGYQCATSGGSAYNGLLITNNVFQVGLTSNAIEETYGIWENSHNDTAGTVMTLSNNQFLGRVGDDFDHAFMLSSQSNALSIDGNIFTGVDDVFYASKSQGHTAGDAYSFTNSVATDVGGGDGIFLRNVTNDPTPIDITVNWNINNTVDGETGIRGLNELSTQATGATRTLSAASDIDFVFGQGPQTTTAVDDNWGSPDRFTDPDGIGTGADPVAYGFNTYTVVQDGINAVTNSTVYVAAGTYIEQLEIDKDLTLIGAGATTIIQSPNTLALCFTTSAANCPIVYVHDADDVTIQDLVVDGAGKGNANYRFMGIGYHNAGGTVDTVEIKDVRDTPFSGSQHGVALYVYNEDSVARSINVWDSEFTGFQKNAMALNASATTPLAVDVQGNTVTGAGTTAITGQNGIQVFADLGTGVVSNNTVSGIAYSGSGYAASSILLYYSDLTISNNTITGGHAGIYNIDGAAQITGNTIGVIKTGGFGYGVIATDPPAAVPSPFGAEDLLAATGDAPKAPNSTLTVNISDNTVTFVGGDNTSTFGIEADSGYGPDDLVVTANNNVVTGFEVGIEFYKCQSGCSAGTFISVTAKDNCLYNNTYGMRSNDSAITVDGKDNWWGSASGPYHSTNPAGTGNQVSDYIDFTPWNTVGCGQTELSLSTADPLFCTGDSTTVLIDLDQVAGLYGYQIEVTYNASLASASGAFVNSFFDTSNPAAIASGWNANCTGGVCRFGVAHVSPQTAVSGSGTLAQITLTGVTPGTFNMTFGTNTLTDIDGALIDHTTITPLPITVCGYATISGNITMQGRPGNNVNAGTVTMTEVTPSFSPVAPVPFSSSNGAYSISVPYLPGGSSYKILAEHGLYLDNEDTILVTGNLANKNTRLWGGDANNSGKVTITDLSCIGGSFGGPVVGSCAGGSSDINADNLINVQDLAIAGGNFDKCNNQPWNWSVDPPNYLTCVP